MRKYQGEDIYVSLELDNPDNPTIQDFTDISNIIIYAYTSSSAMQKFSMVEKTGYSQIESVSDTKKSISIDSEYTKLMSGQLIIEVMVEIPSDTGDNTTTLIKKVQSGIFIVPSTIKNSI